MSNNINNTTNNTNKSDSIHFAESTRLEIVEDEHSKKIVIDYPRNFSLQGLTDFVLTKQEST